MMIWFLILWKILIKSCVFKYKSILFQLLENPKKNLKKELKEE